MSFVPELDLSIVTILDASVASLTFGTNLFRGKGRAKRGLSVNVLLTGGAEGIALTGGESLQTPEATVMIRSDKDDADGGQALAIEIYNVLHLTPDAAFARIKCLQSAPIHFTERNTGEELWTINIEGATVAFRT